MLSQDHVDSSEEKGACGQQKSCEGNEQVVWIRITTNSKWSNSEVTCN